VSVLPWETLESLRTLTRARRDLVQRQTAAGPRLHDELVPLLPELVGQVPHHADWLGPVMLALLSRYSSAQAIACAPLAELTATLAEASGTGASGRHTLCTTWPGTRPPAAARWRPAVWWDGRWPGLCRLCAPVWQKWKPRWPPCCKTLLRRSAWAEIAGSGPHNAAIIRAELGDVSRFSRVDQVMAYAGVEPHTHESGRFAGQKRRVLARTRRLALCPLAFRLWSPYAFGPTGECAISGGFRADGPGKRR
jgi:transposase